MTTAARGDLAHPANDNAAEISTSDMRSAARSDHRGGRLTRALTNSGAFAGAAPIAANSWDRRMSDHVPRPNVPAPPVGVGVHLEGSGDA